MSYILDALRRADADRERERGAVPGLHARPMAGTFAEAKTSTPPAMWLAVAGGVLALLALVAWWALRSPAPAALAPVAEAPPTAAPQVTAAAPPSVAAPTAVAPPPLQMPQIPPPPVQRQVAPPPMARGPLPAPLPSPLPPAARGTAAEPVQRQPPARPATAESTQARATPLGELPAELRREMPAMAVAGSIYSDSPASRFVMINGQVVHEGEPAAPGVTVERIGPKSAVLRWRDMRIEVPL